MSIYKIEKQISKYIEGYVKSVSDFENADKKSFERKYKYSTLKYFHDILGIEQQSGSRSLHSVNLLPDCSLIFFIVIIGTQKFRLCRKTHEIYTILPNFRLAMQRQVRS